MPRTFQGARPRMAGLLCRLCVLFTLTLSGFLMPLAAAWSKDDPFRINSAESRLFQGVWLATAQIDFSLSDEALEALDSGVVLTFELQFRIDRIRRFWLDGNTATLEQRFELSYQPLTERYVVRNQNSGEQYSYATLYSALGGMGRVVDLPIIDAALLDPDGRYAISMRAVLDQNTLPGPLRLIAFWSSGFRLESDWFVWELNV